MPATQETLKETILLPPGDASVVASGQLRDADPRLILRERDLELVRTKKLQFTNPMLNVLAAIQSVISE
jgi:hypothetical protein